MNVHGRNLVTLAGLGVALGFVISMTGLSDWGELHRMFTFRDPRMLLAFAGAVAVAMAGFFLLARRDQIPVKRVVAGGAAFGIKDLAIDGKDLKELGLRPGPLFGEILRTLLDEVVEDPAKNARDTLLARAREIAGTSQ